MTRVGRRLERQRAKHERRRIDREIAESAIEVLWSCEGCGQPIMLAHPVTAFRKKPGFDALMLAHEEREGKPLHPETLVSICHNEACRGIMLRAPGEHFGASVWTRFVDMLKRVLS